MADRCIEGGKEGRRLPDCGSKWSFIVICEHLDAAYPHRASLGGNGGFFFLTTGTAAVAWNIGDFILAKEAVLMLGLRSARQLRFASSAPSSLALAPPIDATERLIGRFSRLARLYLVRT